MHSAADHSPDDSTGNSSGSAAGNPIAVIGRVFTADRSQPWAGGLVVEDGRISFVGSAQDALAAAPAGAEVIDAASGLILPGFVDGHAHLLHSGAALLQAALRDCASVADIQQAVRSWADANPDAPRVIGVGWQFSAIPGGAPTRQMLDEAVADRPVYLNAIDLHSVWANTAALAELGITDSTPNPIGGEIVRDAAGVATGLLMENAGYHLAWPVMNHGTDADHDRELDAAVQAYLAAGTTSAVEMALDSDGLRAMLRAAERGALPFTIHAHWLVSRTGDPVTELAQVARAAELARRHADGPVRVVGIKLVVDGTIDGCTASMLDPYTNGLPGEIIWDAAPLTAVVCAADEAGLQLACHAIGDLAVRTTIDALEIAARARAARGDTHEPRHRIEHLEYVDEADVARLAPLGITASMQPVHCDPAIMGNWSELLGEARASRGFAWPEYLAHGTTLAFGTDTPTAPFEPLPNMYIAATRMSPGHPDIVPHRPDFALPLDEALVHATSESAWATHMDHERGMLRTGLVADIVVLDRDPLADGADELLTAQVRRTIVGGRTVYQR